MPHPIDIVVGDTTAQDVLLDLGPPLRKFVKEDDRMDRIWGDQTQTRSSSEQNKGGTILLSERELANNQYFGITFNMASISSYRPIISSPKSSFIPISQVTPHICFTSKGLTISPGHLYSKLTPDAHGQSQPHRARLIIRHPWCPSKRISPENRYHQLKKSV
jgi:hypothetical protein